MKRSKALIASIMSRVKAKNTQPELELQRELRRLGYRFKTHCKELSGKPDIVFPKERVAIFVDGDFWHGQQWKRRGLPSLQAQFRQTDNRTYWLRKIEKNVRRDASTSRRLRREGWSVLRIWESAWKGRPGKCIAKIQRKLDEKTKR